MKVEEVKMEKIDLDDLFVEDGKNEVAIINSNGEICESVKTQIVQYLEFKKKADSLEKEFKASLLKAMEENGVKAIKNDKFSVTYVEPTTRTTFDTETFKFEHEDLYEKYKKVSNVKSSIRIK